MAYIVTEVSSQEYLKHIDRAVVTFESVQFNELNSHKCEKVLYLLFSDDNKVRFGLIAGIRNKVMKIPFSAPFSIISSNKENKISEYHLAVQALVEYVKTETDILEIYFTMPPYFYAESRIANMQNALFVNGFSIDKIDLNYHYPAFEFDENYIEKIDVKAKQKLRASLKQDLTFYKADEERDILEAYSIIKDNRETKGYPLHMSITDVLDTIKIVKADFFIVKSSLNDGVASAMVFEVTPEIVLVVYWGNRAGTEHLKPMNYLAYKVFEYYNGLGKSIVDIGPSTDNSIPNYGLCDFKQGIGCKTSAKISAKCLICRTQKS